MAECAAGALAILRQLPAGLRALRLNGGINQLAAAAALASVSDEAAIRAEQARNREVKRFVRAQFEALGYRPGPSETNFLFVDVKQDIRPVRERFRAQGLAVGRPFPPLNTHLRVSMGTMPEMERFAAVLKGALA